MNRMFFAVPVIVICSAVLWAAPQTVVSQEGKEDAPSKPETAVPTKIASIRLTETLNAWGGGEAFDVTLRSDGTATLNNHKTTFHGPRVAETFNGTITEKRFDALAATIRDANFFDLKPHYAANKTDQETTTLDVVGDEKTWRVSSYSDGAPPAFFTIVQALKAERDAIDWTKVKAKDDTETDTMTKTAATKSAEVAETEAAKVKAGAVTTCEIHRVALRAGTAPIMYGMPGFTPGLFEARRAQFPHAETEISGGCVVSDDSPKTQAVSFCPQCRQAEAKWIKEHARK